MRVSASFQVIPAPWVGRLGLGPRVVGRLGSRVWVSASFQISALTAGGMSWVVREIVRRRKFPGYMSEGEMSRENVLHSCGRSYA